MMFKKIYTSKYNYIYGLLSFIIYSLSFLIGPDEETSNHLLMPVKAGMILVSSLLYVLSCNEKCSKKVKASYSVLSLVIILYETLLFLAVGKTILYIKDYPAILNSFMWILCGCFSFIRFRMYFFDFLRNIIRSRETVVLITSSILLAAIVIILAAEPTGFRFCWDSDTLYGFIYSLDFDSLYDACSLMFMKVHVSVVYVYLLVLLKLLLGSIRSAFFALNALCIICASFGMTFLYRSLIPGKRLSRYVLADALFLVSPWVCGMSTYGIYDYFIYCLFPLLIYYYTKRNWIGFFSIGTMITFSRAPGIIVFGGVCLGVLIVDVIQNKKRILRDVKYLYFSSVAIVFIIIYLTGRNPERKYGDTSICINWEHIFHLLKQYTTLNFLWIFFILTLIYIIYLFFIKKESIISSTGSAVFVVVLSDLILFSFYCIVITYRIPRYMDSHISVLYICGTLALLTMNHELVASIISGMICLITFICSFRTIDPISLSIFTRVNVGDHDIINCELGRQTSFEDAIVCNRDYYAYEVLVGKVLENIFADKEKDSDILFSLGNLNGTWGLSGGRYSYSFSDGKTYFPVFFDRTIHGLANGYAWEYYDSEEMIPFEIRYVFPEETIDDAVSQSSSDVFYYIYMPTVNHEKEIDITQNYTIISENKFEFRGWMMNYIEFVR